MLAETVEAHLYKIFYREYKRNTFQCSLAKDRLILENLINSLTFITIINVSRYRLYKYFRFVCSYINNPELNTQEGYSLENDSIHSH